MLHVARARVCAHRPPLCRPLQTPLFSGLPKPKPAAKKVVVQFRVPITYGDAPAAAADDDEVRAAAGDLWWLRGCMGGSVADTHPPTLVPAPLLPGRVQERKGKQTASSGALSLRNAHPPTHTPCRPRPLLLSPVQEPSKKKRKTSSRGMSLSDYLPAPKNAGRGMVSGEAAFPLVRAVCL